MRQKGMHTCQTIAGGAWWDPWEKPQGKPESAMSQLPGCVRQRMHHECKITPVIKSTSEHLAC